MRETAYAKVNLALHVRAREPDGYHRLETVFAFAEDGDVLTVGEPETPGAIELEIGGPFAGVLSDASPSGENIVTRAANALRDLHGISTGACLHLDKRLPVASGIGGGSADAAAALRLLTRWWGLPMDQEALHGIARGMGADVPACLLSRTVRGEGRGDELREVDGSALKGRPILLVNPLVPVPTGAVFARWDGVDRGPLGTDLIGRNDLRPAALSLAPVIGEVLEALQGAEVVRMSGSGATCFGLYRGSAECAGAADRIRAARPNWWTLVSRLK